MITPEVILLPDTTYWVIHKAHKTYADSIPISKVKSSSLTFSKSSKTVKTGLVFKTGSYYGQEHYLVFNSPTDAIEYLKQEYQ